MGNDTIRRARLRDCLALAWTLSRALSVAPGTTAVRPVRAVLGLAVQLYTLAVYLPAGDVYTDRDRHALVILTRGRHPGKAAARFLGAVAVNGVLLGLLAAVFAALAGTIAPGWAVVPALLYAWFTCGMFAQEMTGDSAMASLRLLFSRPREPYWLIQGAAARPGLVPGTGFAFLSAAVARAIPRGELMLAVAGSEKLARIYERYGFARRDPGGLILSTRH